MKNKKYGFRDFILKSHPLPHSTPRYTPLTRKTFTEISQLKKGMKVVYYITLLGNFSRRRTSRPRITKIKEQPRLGRFINTESGALLHISELFFYEEEKALGRVE